MTLRSILTTTFLASLMAIATTAAGETISVDYSYQGNTGVNLSRMVGGPLALGAFSDARDHEADAITRPGQTALQLDGTTAADLVRSALLGAFEASNAQLSEETGPLILEGRLVDFQLSENDQGLVVLIRCELNLRKQGRSAWQSVVFSQVQSADTDTSAALAQGLNRLVSELFMDDYFLMELGIF